MNPFDGLPEALQKALSLYYHFGARPHERPPNDWEARRFFRTLDDEHVNIWLEKLANGEGY